MSIKIPRKLRYLLLRLNITRLVTFGYRSEVPERNILIGYIVYMALGFACLLLPFSTREDVSWIDNLFTAASAISTTGLATVDIGTSYTLFGQFIILALVQFGGIGYMTLSSYVIYRVTHHTLKHTDKVVNTSIPIPYGMRMRDLVNNVINFTLIFEALGSVAFFIAFHHAGVSMAGWNALFVSVSSFCTAGFSPFADSLCSFSDNVAVNITVAVLSYAGAMGFIVITDISNKLRGITSSLTFTSKVILLITGVMTVGGTLILSVSPSIAPGGSAADKVWLSFFQTMSAMTTVGYNTIDLSGLRAGPILMFSLIMFIGASPSGTGGGVKCTSVSAVWGFILSKLGLSGEVTFLGRIIPAYRVDTALTSVITYGLMIFTGCVVLSYSEPFRLSQILFEVTSAIGTVGLSTGITAELSAIGKLAIIILMYIGRVGVVTFGSALLIRTRARERCNMHRSDLVA